MTDMEHDMYKPKRDSDKTNSWQ